MVLATIKRALSHLIIFMYWYGGSENKSKLTFYSPRNRSQLQSPWPSVLIKLPIRTKKELGVLARSYYSM